MIGTHVVYWFFDADDRPLYIGMTSQEETRWKYHANTQSWWSAVARCHVEGPYPDRATAAAAERIAIARDQPIHNTQHTGRPMHHHRIVGGNCRACVLEQSA